MATARGTAPSSLRSTYIFISTFVRREARSRRHYSSGSGSFVRSDFSQQGFTGSYDAGQPTTGPLGDVSLIGHPVLTPKVLKNHLDQFVVGQERAKKILSVAVFNHYQRVLEMQRREEEEQQALQQRLRRERGNLHPLEDEYPGHSETIPLDAPEETPILDTSPLLLEKSNILLLGPSGVGKTLLAKTLARVLSVPFSMSDCTPFTQAGYIGEDAQVCVERLLAAADWDVEMAENGIICLDEIDKIAANRPAHGKDVGGEGVQQALLKIIEGTTLHIQAKGASASGKVTATPTNASGPGAPTSSFGSKFSSASSSDAAAKPESYTVRTDNILFICTGAFTGLHKTVLNRISKGSIGFGSPIRSAKSGNESSDMLVSAEPGSEESKLFEKHLPFFTAQGTDKTVKYNPLDLVEPIDLQTYGMIPELIGRVPVTAALSALDEEALVRVLTEPRNSIIKQYEALFKLSGIELCFTRGALQEIAKTSLSMGTGARGLRTCVERLLAEAMFEAPGSSIKHILITAAVAQKKAAPIYFARGQQHKMHDMLATEDDEWSKSSSSDSKASAESIRTFEEYRQKTTLAGSG